MVPCLLLSGTVVDSFSLLMGSIDMFNFIVKLNDMRENLQFSFPKVKNSGMNLKIILWWAGVFLGKSLHI